MNDFQVGDIVTFTIASFEYEVVDISSDRQAWVVRCVTPAAAGKFFDVQAWQIASAKLVRAGMSVCYVPKYTVEEILARFVR